MPSSTSASLGCRRRDSGKFQQPVNVSPALREYRQAGSSVVPAPEFRGDAAPYPIRNQQRIRRFGIQGRQKYSRIKGRLNGSPMASSERHTPRILDAVRLKSRLTIFRNAGLTLPAAGIFRNHGGDTQRGRGRGGIAASRGPGLAQTRGRWRRGGCAAPEVESLSLHAAAMACRVYAAAQARGHSLVSAAMKSRMSRGWDTVIATFTAALAAVLTRTKRRTSHNYARRNCWS